MHALRYYYEQRLADGKVIRLEIHRKNSILPAMEIGPVVQGLSMRIDGTENDVDKPIIQTSLSMTFVDAPDLPEASYKKCGDWGEFFTPDSTEWMVVVKGRRAGEDSFRTLWGGYVTPDSYSEDLVYRGSVTITVRDNVGHLNDFPFDGVGDYYDTISMRELLEQAWAKIESPMLLTWCPEWLECEGVAAPDTRMNLSAFKDRNWYEVVESALFAYGSVLRYVGGNHYRVSPLRYASQFSYSDYNDVPTFVPTFVNGATRMLYPAAKRIEESVKYEIVEVLQRLVKTSDYSGDIVEIADGTGFTSPAWSLTNNESGVGWKNPSDGLPLYFNPASYGYSDENAVFDSEEKRNLPNKMMLLCNSKEGRAIFSRYMNSVDAAFHIKLGNKYYLAAPNVFGKYSQIYCKVTKVVYSVSAFYNGTTYYLQSDGQWDSAVADLVIEDTNDLFNVDIYVPANFGGTTLIELTIHQIDLTETLSSSYIVIESLSIGSPENAPLLSTNRVNTVYNSSNNIIITRDPEIGPAYNKVVEPGVLKNAIFYINNEGYLPARRWAWPGNTPQQMAVYNHLQLLCYHAKPNNVIEGTIVNGDITRVDNLWLWENKKHILMGGTYDFLSGFITGAILREFVWYDEMWNDVPDSDMPNSEESSESNIEAGASSSGGGGAYENTTNVGIHIGGEGPSYLRDLLDVNTDNSTRGSVLVYNGTQWVDRSFPILLDEGLQDSFFLKSLWYLDDDGNLCTDKQVRIKNNLIVEGDTASGGEGEDTPARGTVTGVEINGAEYRPDSRGVIDLSLAFDNVTVDLSGYYTKEEASSIFLKKEDAGNIYTKKSDFDQLRNDFDALSGLLNDDTSGVIDTWNEVVSFLDGYSGSEDLAAILSKIDGRITSLLSRKIIAGKGLAGGGDLSEDRTLTVVSANDAISVGTDGLLLNTVNNLDSTSTIKPLAAAQGKALSDRMNPLETWVNSIKEYLTYEEGAVRVKGNLIVTGDTSSGGEGEDTPASGTVIGVRVGDDVYDSVSNGLLSLDALMGKYALKEDAPNVSWVGDYSSGKKLGTLTIGEYEYYVYSPSKLSEFEDDVVAGKYLSLTGGTIDGNLSIPNDKEIRMAFNNGVYDTVMKMDTGNHLLVGSGTSLSGADTHIYGVNLFLRYSASRTTGLILNSSGNVTIGESDLAGIKHKLYVDGNIKTESIKALSLELYYSTPFIDFHFDNSDEDFTSRIIEKQKGMLTINGTLNAFLNGNVGIGTTSPAYKLDVNGSGRFTGNLTFTASAPAMQLYRTSGTPYILFGKDDTTKYGEIGIGSDGEPVFWSYNDSKSYYNRWLEIIHSGNVGDINAGGMVLKRIENDNPESYSAFKVNSTVFWGLWKVGEELSYSYGLLLNSPDATRRAILAFGAFDDIIRVRVQTEVNTWSDWKQIICSDTLNDTLNSYALFFENGPYDANTITRGGFYRLNAKTAGSHNWPIDASYGNAIHVQTSKADTAFQLTAPQMNEQRLFFRTFSADKQSSQSWKEIAFTDSNVASASKLETKRRLFGWDFDGTQKIGQNIFIESGYNTGVPGSYGSEINRFGGNLYLQARGDASEAPTNNLYCCIGGGLVGIGTTSPAYKLDVNGSGRFTGNLIVNGDTASGSDIRFKDRIEDKTIRIEDIANAPLFTFKWNDRDDDSVHLGSSAQYWENICPWIVSGEAFKTLNYATLGVAMGISLAKKAENHEERIAALEKENKELKEKIRRLEYGNVC